MRRLCDLATTLYELVRERDAVPPGAPAGVPAPGNVPQPEAPRSTSAMWRHVHHRLVVGYHGCDATTAEKVLLRGEHLREVDNGWDWLGQGIYFWEHGRDRAWAWAEAKRDAGRFDTPAVIGAYISLGNCFDLTDTAATKQLKRFYDDLCQAMQTTGQAMPANVESSVPPNDPLVRRLDCAVLNVGLNNLDLEEQGRTSGASQRLYQTVRGVFVEGSEPYPGAAIRLQTHIQIAVRDPACILGYFRVPEYTKEEDRDE